MAFKVIDEKSVYQCVGYPLPTDIEKIVRILLNDSVEDAYTSKSILLILNLHSSFPLLWFYLVEETVIIAVGEYYVNFNSCMVLQK